MAGLRSGESVSEVPPASIQVEVARLHAPRRNAGRQTRYRAAPTIHAKLATVITETREAADQFAREGEAACIYVDTIEWCKTFRGMA